MQAFSYVSARTLSEAADILAREGDQAKCLSGGTDLIVFLREGRRSAKVVVDVKGIPELNQLGYSPKEGLTIGAAVPLHRIYNDAHVIEHYPGLIDAATLIGGIAIQGRATLGGNVCTASPAGDSIPILIAYETTCIVASRNVTKAIPLEKFFVGPGRTVLQPGELLVALKLPPPKPNSGAAYLRFIPRNEMDIAVTSAGAMVVLDEDKRRFVGARLALGAVAPTPLFVPEAGAALTGQPVSDEVIEAAARAAQAAARPITDMRGSAEQRKHLSYVMTKRALLRAIERARGG
ncbi:MAG: xanthine dehydrogenase family protein subunit M [Chloroflexi bacterium]|nr:MAG: xanthine dehydrogenase family protein subunit M [Chloroflexota bacterium]